MSEVINFALSDNIVYVGSMYMYQCVCMRVYLTDTNQMHETVGCDVGINNCID